MKILSAQIVLRPHNLIQIRTKIDSILVPRFVFRTVREVSSKVDLPSLFFFRFLAGASLPLPHSSSPLPLPSLTFELTVIILVHYFSIVLLFLYFDCAIHGRAHYSVFHTISSAPLQLEFLYLSYIVTLTCVANKSYYIIPSKSVP